MKQIVVASSACLVLLAGCGPTTKYEWGAYPHALLAYYKSPAERVDYDKALDEALAKGEADNKVPPGLYAEAGYKAMAQGDTQRAMTMFAKEKAAWPESTIFMDKAMHAPATARGQAQPPAAAAQPAPGNDPTSAEAPLPAEPAS